jgi:arylsulfatase A-like enzyme
VSRRRLPATLLLAALACARGEPEAAAPRSNAILISIDTLRADHVGAYGHPLPTTPHIDALAADGLRVATCVAQAPITLASHASILTSLLPWHHGASIPLETRLADGVVTLAEVLAAHGWRTASWNGGIQLDAAYGLDRGFEVYESARPPDARAQVLVGPEDRLRHGVDRAIAWIESLGAAGQRAPFFVFLHSYEIHHPYTPDPEDMAALGGDYAGSLPDHIPVELLEQINDGARPVTREDVAHIARAYDAELRSADAAVGRLVAWLRETRRYDDTLIAVTSDHGEELGEHGRVGWHAHTLYDELLLVPLVIKFPGSRLAGAIDARQARGIDVAPTLLAALGVDAPAGFAGRDLARGAGEAGEGLPAVSLHDLPGTQPVWGIRTPRWKLKEVGVGSLHDLRADPRELHDVIASHPDRADELRRAGLALLGEREHRRGRPAPVAERTREQLRALGYTE